MIHHIFSTLPSFKNLGDLKPGLNVLLAQKTEGATTKQTRNRAGKTSFVELVHVLLGADAGPAARAAPPQGRSCGDVPAPLSLPRPSGASAAPRRLQVLAR